MITVIKRSTTSLSESGLHSIVIFSDGTTLKTSSMESKEIHEKALDEEILEALYEKNQNLKQLEIEAYFKTLPVEGTEPPEKES